MKHWTTFFAISLLAAPAGAGEWPQWGRDNTRNMVSPEKGLPAEFNPGKPPTGGDAIDLATTENVKWIAKLGSQSYGNPTVAGGKVFVGTNNDVPRDPSQVGDFGVLMCFSAADGKFLWQHLTPKLLGGKAVDYEQVGLCSSPTIDGGRVYIVTNRCEVVCLDAGASDKPQVCWRYDMRAELGVIPYNATSNSALVVGDRLYVSTCNAVDFTQRHIPNPNAPALICLNKQTGKLLGGERSGISSRTFHSNWCSPSWGKAGGQELILFGGGDGFCYAFDPVPTTDGALRELWRFDCNPPGRRTKADGKPIKYGTDKGPSEALATPVMVDGRVYASIGQDPESGDGVGCLSCIDATRTGDITASGAVWRFTSEAASGGGEASDEQLMHRTLSTVSLADGLVFVADFTGFVRCLEAATGKCLWSHDAQSHIWGSTLVADGKVYVGCENGTLTILAASHEKKVLATPTFDGPVYSTPVVADGVLYVMTDKYLYAIHQKAGK